MLYLKTYESYNPKDFLEWLSIQFNQIIGDCLGTGMFGTVLEFGKKGKRVIKLTNKMESDTYSIINKNIKGVAKVYSYGKIKVPKKFLEKSFGTIKKYIKHVDFNLNTNSNGYVYYIIMERLFPNKDLENDINDLRWMFENYYEDMEGGTIDIPALRRLFEERDNIPLLQKFSDYIKEYHTNNYNKKTELLAELIVLFRKISKYFDWMDIHSGQFAYDINGEIKAYDLDNSHIIAQDEIKNIIKESK